MKNEGEKKDGQQQKKRLMELRIVIIILIVIVIILLLLRACVSVEVSQILGGGDIPLTDWLFPDESESQESSLNESSEDGGDQTEGIGSESGGGQSYGNEDGVKQLETSPALDSAQPGASEPDSDGTERPGDRVRSSEMDSGGGDSGGSSNSSGPGQGSSDSSSGSDESSFESSNGSSSSQETHYELVEEDIRDVSPAIGTELSVPVSVTALPPDNMKCRAIEIVIPLPDGIGVENVAASPHISDADMGWYVSDGVLRIAYVAHNTSAMRFVRQNVNTPLVILELRFEKSFLAESSVSISSTRLLARNGGGGSLAYKIDENVAEVLFGG